jgi:hypothetical protein
MRKITSFGLITALFLVALGTWAMTGTASDASTGARLDAIDTMTTMAVSNMPAAQYDAF